MNGAPTRTHTIYDGRTVIEVQMIACTWGILRRKRDKELMKTDFWALGDRPLTDEQRDYRTMLRELPTNHATADDAADAWNAYEKPED